MLSAPMVTIAVPVRNEAARLPRLLAALAGQRGAPPFTLCLFFDNCTDASREIVLALAAAQPYRIVSDACDRATPPNAGRARAAAGALAVAQAPERALLSTDADSEPAPGWVRDNLRALARAEIVAGRLRFRGRTLAPVQARLIAYYDRLHAQRRLLDPVSWEAARTHHWTSAASLALRPDTFRSLGGFAPLPRGEDADLADRAWRAGHRLRRDACPVVLTSARRKGRAEGGFADTLASLDGREAMPHVAHPADETWRYRQHAAARLRFASGDVAPLAGPLGLPVAEIEQVAGECTNADAFAARIVGAPPGGMRHVALPQAELLLRLLRAGPVEQAA